jgi:hypothetical protein
VVRYSSELERIVRKTIGEIIDSNSFKNTSQRSKESELALLNRVLGLGADNWAKVSPTMERMLLREAQIRWEIRQTSFYQELKLIRWGDWDEQNIAQCLEEVLRFASNEWNAALHRAHNYEQASDSRRELAWLGREKAVILKDICIQLATLIEEVKAFLG